MDNSCQKEIIDSFDQTLKIVEDEIKNPRKEVEILNFPPSGLNKQMLELLYTITSIDREWVKIRDDFVKRSAEEGLLVTSVPISGHHRAENGFYRYFEFVTHHTTILVFSYDPETGEIQELFYRTFDIKLPRFYRDLVLIKHFSKVTCVVDKYNRDTENVMHIDEILNSTVIKLVEYIKKSV